MPLRKIRANIAVILAIVALVVSLACYYIFGIVGTKLVLDVMLLGASFIVSVTWATAAFQALKDGARESGDKVVLTVWISWTALLIQRVYALWISVVAMSSSRDPVWIRESPASVVVATLILIAGAYASYATVSTPNVPLREQKLVLTASFLGGLLVGGTLATALILGLHF